jgi:F0F1-type ATP synthase assembly protein I
MNDKRPPGGHEETRLARRVKTASQISAAIMIPSMILIGLVGGYFLGAWVQGRLGGAPWVSFVGLVLGGVAAVRKVVEILRAPTRRPDE